MAVTESPVESVEEHRDDLETLANGDGPAAWVAEELLDAVEHTGGDGR